jgi:predicted ATP-dependent serine protease
MNVPVVADKNASTPGHRQERKAGKLVICSADNLRTKNFPPIRFIVEGFIVEGCTLLAGKPKLGKSWMMLDIALATSLGQHCLGNVKCDQGAVLYLALEDNERRLQKRIYKLASSRNGHLASIFATEWPRVNDGGIQAIRDWIEKTENPRLIVVDVLAMFRPTTGGRETLYEADYGAIKGLQALASKFRVAS